MLLTQPSLICDVVKNTRRLRVGYRWPRGVDPPPHHKIDVYYMIYNNNKIRLEITVRVE